jgi:hypothetical protein
MGIAIAIMRRRLRSESDRRGHEHFGTRCRPVAIIDAPCRYGGDPVSGISSS